MDLCCFLLNSRARPQITDTQESSVMKIAWDKMCTEISPGQAAELASTFEKNEWFQEQQFIILHKSFLSYSTGAEICSKSY